MSLPSQGLQYKCSHLPPLLLLNRNDSYGVVIEGGTRRAPLNLERTGRERFQGSPKECGEGGGEIRGGEEKGEEMHTEAVM